MSKFAKEMKAIQKMLEALEPLEEQGRLSAIKMVVDRLRIDFPAAASAREAASSAAVSTAQTGAAQSGGGVSPANQADVKDPRRFLLTKHPQKDIERVACLAFLLKYGRATGEFKTADLLKMNTDAAGRALSNPSMIAQNAVQAGYLAKAGDGKKQITPLGDMVVEALPDQNAVKNVIAEHAPRRRKTRKRKSAKKP